MLIVLGNVTVVVMVMALALSGERRWRQRKSRGNNYKDCETFGGSPGWFP